MNRLSSWKVTRNVFIILLCVAGAVAASMAISNRTAPRYRSVAQILITPNATMYEGRDLLTALDTLDRSTVLATYVEVLNSPSILQAAASSLSVTVGDDEPFEVSSLVLPGSNMLEVTAEGPNATAVAALANTVVAQGSEYLRERFVMYQIHVLTSAEPASEPFEPNVMRSALVAGALAGGVGVIWTYFLGWMSVIVSSSRTQVPTRMGRSNPALKR